MLGVSLIIPITAPLILDNSTGLIPVDFPVSLDIIYGFLVGSYPIAQFFGAPILGAMSDRFGRKKVLQISLIGSILGYLLFGYAIAINNLPLMFMSRLLDGFTGGNISVVFSAVSDVSDAKSRAKNFGLIGMALGLGFILGPVTGGLLSNPDLVSWFDFSTPFWASAAVCGLNYFVVTTQFKETFTPNESAPVNILEGLTNIRDAFKMPNLKIVLSSRFFLTMGFSFFTLFFAAFLVKKFDYGPSEIGWLFGYVGFWIALAQGGLVRLLARWFSPVSLIRITTFTLGGALILCLLPSEPWMLYLIIPFVALSQGTLTPNITAVVSFQATKEQQGKIMGINQSIISLGQAVPPFFAGFLSSMNSYYPTVAAAIFVLSGAVIFLLFFKEPQDTR